MSDCHWFLVPDGGGLFRVLTPCCPKISLTHAKEHGHRKAPNRKTHTLAQTARSLLLLLLLPDPDDIDQYFEFHSLVTMLSLWGHSVFFSSDEDLQSKFFFICSDSHFQQLLKACCHSAKPFSLFLCQTVDSCCCRGCRIGW